MTGAQGKTAAMLEAHRSMVARIVRESSFEAIMQLVCDEAGDRSGLDSKTPTIKQRRYRALAPTLAAALDAATMGRI